MLTKQPIIDLQEAIADLINTHIKENYFDYNKDFIFIQFLDKYDQIGFTPSPGSHLVDEDYSGEQYWQYNYAFTVKTQHRGKSKGKLFELSEYLQSLNKSKEKLISKNRAWTFDHVEIPSAPAEVMEDLKGTATYNMDVAVFVYE
ncbi:MAG: Minor capsid protein from bacteriophage [Bacteriophage sp.]|nr:MAG: Minor capsid protein from bacteriophage [Bacteriophage sp.]